MLCSALLSSQAPEFAQQYRQRLGGAIDELRSIVNNFDKDANNQGLSRDQALNQLATAQQAFFQSRAISMTQTFDRYSELIRQQDSFNLLNPALKPIALFATVDKPILNGTWQDYQPALPLTVFGALWTIIGAIFGWVAILLVMLPFSSKKTKRSRKVIAPKF